MTNDLDHFESALLTELRSHVAERAIDQHPARRTRSRRLAAMATTFTVGALGLGSVAYATGLVPQFVTDAFDELDEASPHTFDVTGIKPIADFTLPDGTAVTVWRGQNDLGGSCEAIRENRAGEDDDEFRASCFDGSDRAFYERITFSQIQRPEAPGEAQHAMYYIAYGEAPSPGATQVRITGDGTDMTVPVDATTAGFGSHLAGLVPPPDGQLVDLTFSFLDAQGSTIDVVDYGPSAPQGELGMTSGSSN
jgi:hypothetical protein